PVTPCHGVSRARRSGSAPETERPGEQLHTAAAKQDPPQDGTLLEPRRIEPAVEVATPERPNSFGLVGDERDDRQTKRYVVVGGRRVKQRDLPEEWHDAKPVAQQDEEKEGAYEGDVLRGRGTGAIHHEVDQSLDGDLEASLEPARDERQSTGAGVRQEEEDRHHDPHRQERVRDRDVVSHEADQRFAREEVKDSRRGDVRPRRQAIEGPTDEHDRDVDRDENAKQGQRRERRERPI